jgi:Ferritin-like domain/TAT (twin-arginine translocation) pathway signal sequence
VLEVTVQPSTGTEERYPVEKKLNDLIDKALSRRTFLAGAGTAAAASVLAGCGSSSSSTTTTTTPVTPVTPAITDADILTFALNLEYLEAEYYLYASTGSGLSAADAGTGAGTTIVPSTTRIAFATPYIQQYANEIAQDELNHVRFLRAALTAAGATVQPRPAIDLTFFAGLATAAGISGTFNPFADENSFLVGAFVFEDVGVTAYSGAAPLITNKASYLSPAAGIQAVEAYHAAEIRTIIAANAASSTATSAQTAALANANLVSALRGKISAASGNMLAAETTLSTSSIVAADSTNAIAFARTTDQVLHIVYGGTAGVGVAKGGFFPAGLNGTIKSTTT